MITNDCCGIRIYHNTLFSCVRQQQEAKSLFRATYILCQSRKSPSCYSPGTSEAAHNDSQHIDTLSLVMLIELSDRISAACGHFRCNVIIRSKQQRYGCQVYCPAATCLLPLGLFFSQVLIFLSHPSSAVTWSGLYITCHFQSEGVRTQQRCAIAMALRGPAIEIKFYLVLSAWNYASIIFSVAGWPPLFCH